MQNFIDALPVISNVLLICLLIAGFILIIKCIKLINHANKVIKNVEDKINSVNGLFEVAGTLSNSVSRVVTKAVGFGEKVVSRFFKRASSRMSEEEELEEILRKEEE